MAISDEQFRAGVIGAGVLMALGIGALRFCGDVSLPSTPPGVRSEPAATSAPATAGAETSSTSADLLATSESSPAMYLDLLARDAAVAGIATPTLAEMSRKLPHRVDPRRHVLEVGQRPIELAGLRLAAVRAGDAIGLEIRNDTRSDLAYLVISSPAPGVEGCDAARPLPLNVLVIGAGQRETRVECAWRDDLAIEVSRVETIELSPLSAWYVSQVPPEVLGIEERIARGHRNDRSGGGGGGAGGDAVQPCSAIVPQAVQTGLERGEIGWRDLIDFYARHRCQTYQFPLSYRAFTADGAYRLPVVGLGG